jgi:hypothetical protein
VLKAVHSLLTLYNNFNIFWEIVVKKRHITIATAIFNLNQEDSVHIDDNKENI